MALNTIGYIKKELPAEGKLICLSVPLFNMSEADNVFGRMSFAKEVPAGSSVSFWNEVSQVWNSGIKSTKGWAPGESNYVIKAGEAFFLKGPASSVEPTEITITGEVPPDTTLSRTVVGASMLGTVANPFPVDFKFGASELAKNSAAGSSVAFWNELNQVWNSGIKSTKGWAPGESNYVVKATEGFFLREAGSPTEWAVDKPYTWP